MYVSDNPRLIFIHIPKTGGSAIRGLLRDMNMHRIGGRHNVLGDLPKAKRYTKYQALTIVRNPYDRIISMYRFHHMYRHLDPVKHAKRWGDLDITKTAMRSFSDFVQNRAEHRIPLIQYDFIKHDDIHVRVYRYEESAHERIRQDFGVSSDVPKDFEVNYLGEYDKREWCDEEGLEFIRKWCAKDFKAFGYPLEPDLG